MEVFLRRLTSVSAGCRSGLGDMLWFLAVPLVLLVIPAGRSVVIPILAGYLVAVAILFVRRWVLSARARRQEYVVPRELPPAPALVGRDPEIAELAELLSAGRSKVVGIHGPAGIGKTVLALRLAHSVAGSFPDGQLVAQLRVPPGDTATTVRILKQFIWSLQGPWDDEPDGDLAELVDRYRKLTRFRRVLVVLDDAASAETVRQLLPEGADCGVIVTSQEPLAVGADVHWRELGSLAPQDGRQLLAAVVGGDLAKQAERGPTDLVVERARHLPLNLRLVGTVIAARSPADLTTSFRLLQPVAIGPGRPLDLGFAFLTAEEQRAVRLLGLLEADEPLAPWMLAGLAGLSAEDARVLISRLVQAGLVEQVPGREPGLVEFRVLDHTRRYALALAEDPRDALQLGEARTARARSSPVAGPAEIRRLQETGRLTEALTVVADAMSWAAEHDRAAALPLIQIVAAELHIELGDLEAAEDLIEAAATSGDPLLRLHVMRVAGLILRRQGQPRRAADILSEALRRLDELGSPVAEHTAEKARLLRHRAEALRDDGRLEAATADLDEATRLASALADRAAEPLRMSLDWTRATVSREAGAFAEAVTRFTGVRAGAQRQGRLAWHAWIALDLARTQLRVTRPAAAAPLIELAQRDFVQMGHRYGKAKARVALAALRLSENPADTRLAVTELERALETLRNCGDRWAEAEVAQELAVHLPALGRGSEALVLLRAAAGGFAAVGDVERARVARRRLLVLAWRLLPRTTAIRLSDLVSLPATRPRVRWTALIATTLGAGDR
ncbi:NB-ARC domain-containing protein [Paractinoplanes lichenicola]|uniref:AAA family ATPase n=1 Tax=Paractinoplanes lichenicola TaxID=2802976 RepID=A0ABS1VT19_9ACTN|nr:NB-ARC domain-containing protein [Actinoplanes lichenicola]MBL7257610.1 AAA family ATPase [Actinoplanes lichenicola]